MSDDIIQEASYLAKKTILIAGDFLKSKFGKKMNVDEDSQHDIKIALDKECQKLIENEILKRFPDHEILGEEGSSDSKDTPYRWVIDPIDGTVNYFYNIPHFCTSIALQKNEKTVLGVIFDPMKQELWHVTEDEFPTLNGEPIKVSSRKKISEAIVSVGFAKSFEDFKNASPILLKIAPRVRKCRMMGSAALDLAFVATGRIDAYIEKTINLWDIAAGMLLIEKAGGIIGLEEKEEKYRYKIIASSGAIDELGSNSLYHTDL